MDYFWQKLTELLYFTGVKDTTVWQDVAITAFLLPIIFFLIQRIIIFLDVSRPIKALFKGYIGKDVQPLIFHSQLRAVDDFGKPLHNPKYINEFPSPTPTNRRRLGSALKQNIDPVWSEADGECLTNVYNLLGRANKLSGIEIADTIKDWSKHNRPIISVGFNPKTHDLEKRCTEIDYELDLGNATLNLPKMNVSVDAYRPNDGAVIQKTFLKSTGQPVLILAGLGTIGTSAAGYVITNEANSIGKLYGNKRFCVLLKADSNIGTTSGEIVRIYPYPKAWRIVLYPVTFSRYYRNNFFWKREIANFLTTKREIHPLAHQASQLFFTKSFAA